MTQIARVTALPQGISAINVRQSPDIRGMVVGSLVLGDTFTLLDEQNGWVQTERGWFSLQSGAVKYELTINTGVQIELPEIWFEDARVREGVALVLQVIAESVKRQKIVVP